VKHIIINADNFRKSKHSAGVGACIEVASKEVVLLRDSTDPDGTCIPVTPTGWRKFVRLVKAA
jgi:hypothetical protein